MSEFCFVIHTDSHLSAHKDEDTYYWNRMLHSRAREIMDVAIGDTNTLRPDFAVHCGDLTDDSEPDSFCIAAEIMSQLNYPLYFVPGNHDTWVNGSRELVAELMDLGAPPFFREVEHEGWRLLFMDTAYWIYKDKSVHDYIDWKRYHDMYMPDSQVDWVRTVLDRDPEKPTICFAHSLLAMRDDYPIGRMPEGQCIEQGPEIIAGNLCMNPRLKPLIASYPCVKAFFCGHGHFHDCIVENGTLYCQTASLTEYPVEIRQVRVTSDSISVKALPLTRGNFSDLSYMPQWNNTWTAGRQVDRCYCHHF